MTDRSAAAEAQARLDSAKSDLKLAIGREGTEADRQRAVERIDMAQRALDRVRRDDDKLAHRRRAAAHLVTAATAADRIARIDAEVATIQGTINATGWGARVKAFRDRLRMQVLMADRKKTRAELAEAVRSVAHETDLGLTDISPVYRLWRGAGGATDLSDRLRSASRELERVAAGDRPGGVVDLTSEPSTRHASLRLLLDDVRDKIDHELGFGCLVGADAFSSREWLAAEADRDEMRAASQTILATSDRPLVEDVRALGERLEAASGTVRRIGGELLHASWRRRLADVRSMDDRQGIDPDMMARIAAAAGFDVDPPAREPLAEEAVPGPAH